MTHFAAARPGLAARLALASAAFVLSSCSGGVTPVVNDPETITILPSTATLYSGLPTTFSVTGGTGAYIVTSSNQAAIQVSGAVQSGPITIVPNYVVADTPVTLTVRDTGATPIVTATLTVKPNPVNNDISIIPSPTQGSTCAPAVCSGGDAQVVATISQGGIPLPARGVRLDVVSGDFRFIVTPPGSTGGEILSTSIEVVSDELGKVHARLRALADAPNQTALLQVTDLGTGAFQRASFPISQQTGPAPGFTVTPSNITFQGAFVGQCTNGLRASFFVLGGTPPYTVLSGSGDAFTVTPTFIGASGEGFEVTTRGICTSDDGLPITVRDAAGRTATVTVANIQGTTPITPVTVSPTSVTLTSCTGAASTAVLGGVPPYVLSFGHTFLTATVSGGTLTVRRRAGSGDPGAPTTVQVGVTDRRTSATLDVNLDAAAAGPC